MDACDSLSVSSVENPIILPSYPRRHFRHTWQLARWISRSRWTTRAIERILPHRYPFLLVDRITEFEPDKRIVGIKNVTLNERYLAHRAGRAAGAAADDPDRGGRPGRRDHDPGEAGEPRETASTSRASSACGIAGRCIPGDVVVIEALVRRLRSRMGLLRGVARVDGQVVVEGTMTFALGPRNDAAQAPQS